VGGAVGAAEGELAVGSECDDPAVVVDLVVVHAPDGEEVVEVGLPPLINQTMWWSLQWS